MPQSKPFRIIDEIEVGKAGNISLFQADLITPTNETTSWGFVKANDGVIVLPLDENKHVYLKKEWRIVPKDFTWELPAGGIEQIPYTEEEVMHAANKELQEEIGMKANKLTKLLTCHSSNKVRLTAHIYLAEDLIPSKLKTDDHEYLEVAKLPFDQAYELLKTSPHPHALSLLTFLLTKEYLKV